MAQRLILKGQYNEDKKILKCNFNTLSEADVTNKELDNVIEDVRKDISKAFDNNEKKYLEKRRSKIPKK